jgi:hypothetical protein
MDPTQCYLEMMDAIRDGELATARERALALRDWLERGGFYPANFGDAEVRSKLADVLRQARRRNLSEDDSD